MVIIDLFGKNRLNEEEEKNLNKWRRLTSNQHTYSYNVAAVVSVGAKHNNRIVLNHDRRKRDSTGVNSHSTKSICGLYTHTHSQRNDEINVRFTSTIYTCTAKHRQRNMCAHANDMMRDRKTLQNKSVDSLLSDRNTKYRSVHKTDELFI